MGSKAKQSKVKACASYTRFRIRYFYDEAFRVYRSTCLFISKRGAKYQVIVDLVNWKVGIKNVRTERIYWKSPVCRTEEKSRRYLFILARTRLRKMGVKMLSVVKSKPFVKEEPCSE